MEMQADIAEMLGEELQELTGVEKSSVQLALSIIGTAYAKGIISEREGIGTAAYYRTAFSMMSRGKYREAQPRQGLELLVKKGYCKSCENGEELLLFLTRKGKAVMECVREML